MKDEKSVPASNDLSSGRNHGLFKDMHVSPFARIISECVAAYKFIRDLHIRHNNIIAMSAFSADELCVHIFYAVARFRLCVCVSVFDGNIFFFSSLISLTIYFSLQLYFSCIKSALCPKCSHIH